MRFSDASYGGDPSRWEGQPRTPPPAISEALFIPIERTTCLPARSKSSAKGAELAGPPATKVRSDRSSTRRPTTPTRLARSKPAMSSTPSAPPGSSMNGRARTSIRLKCNACEDHQSPGSLDRMVKHARNRGPAPAPFGAATVDFVDATGQSRRDRLVRSRSDLVGRCPSGGVLARRRSELRENR
jgi:hypothetical protein